MTDLTERRRRMTTEQFSAALTAIEISAREFASLMGLNDRAVQRWLTGELDIPHWTPIALGLMTLPGGLEMAEKICDVMWELDEPVGA